MSDIMISVDDVSMLFNLNRGKVRTLKERLMKKTNEQVDHESLFKALDHVSFQVQAGETLGIVGSNGAGKSTLLKIISGIMKPTAGKISVEGTIAPMIELGAGFDMELSAIENIHLSGAILGNQKKDIQSRVAEILDFAELWDFKDVPVKYYSSGMLARLAFATSSIITPDVLIVDEILAVGDYDFTQKSLKRMLQLMGGGTTVVYVSHDMDSVMKLCNRVIWLEHGRIRMVGDTESVCNLYIEKVKKSNGNTSDRA